MKTRLIRSLAFAPFFFLLSCSTSVNQRTTKNKPAENVNPKIQFQYSSNQSDEISTWEGSLGLQGELSSASSSQGFQVKNLSLEGSFNAYTLRIDASYRDKVDTTTIPLICLDAGCQNLSGSDTAKFYFGVEINVDSNVAHDAATIEKVLNPNVSYQIEASGVTCLIDIDTSWDYDDSSATCNLNADITVIDCASKSCSVSDCHAELYFAENYQSLQQAVSLNYTQPLNQEYTNQTLSCSFGISSQGRSIAGDTMTFNYTVDTQIGEFVGLGTGAGRPEYGGFCNVGGAFAPVDTDLLYSCLLERDKNDYETYRRLCHDVSDDAFDATACYAAMDALDPSCHVDVCAGNYTPPML